MTKEEISKLADKIRSDDNHPMHEVLKEDFFKGMDVGHGEAGGGGVVDDESESTPINSNSKFTLKWEKVRHIECDICFKLAVWTNQEGMYRCAKCQRPRIGKPCSI